MSAATLARRVIGGAALTALPATSAGAQAPADVTPPVRSMGQPSRWQPGAAGLAMWDRRERGAGATIALGVHRPLLNPVSGIVGITGEGYGTAGGAFDGGGARLLARSPLLGLAVGADWNVSHSRVDFMLSFQTAIRRGGLLGHGTMLRADWLPTRGRSLGVGVHVPLMQPFAGRTRPRRTEARLPRARDYRRAMAGTLSAATETALAEVADAASLIAEYSSLFSAESERRIRSAPGHAAVSAAYRAGLVRAFGAAAGDPARAEPIARRARAGLLRDVLLPYDALFGQPRDDAGIRGLAAAAQSGFERWLRDSSGVASAAQPAVLRVHARWLASVDGVQRSLRARWGDTRTVWLPLQLALAPEEFDEQSEVDSLLARAVGHPFTDQNAVTLLRSTDLPMEIARSILAARDYHVLWTHDFAGRRDKTKSVDNLAYEMVSDVYLPALTAAVKRYDAVGRLPLFMILIDQFFYEPRVGRLWMTILEDPLRASMRLPGDNGTREAHLRERQAELRAAVAASARLQRDARARGGERWLRRTVKVHVSVPHPADFSFRSHQIVPGIPFTPDNIMRDHRKIVLYDLTEAEPYRGAMMLMGIGIGEHYSSDTWEDRGYQFRGPAALEARAAVRRLLRRNGFDDDDIPPPLREVASTRVVEAQANQGDFVGRALQVHNEVGFGAKQSSVARALLYDLAQPGSVIVVPDPLWLSAEWAAMLAGAAARGARVHVIAPALENAPSPQAPLMALAHDVMLRLLELRAGLAEPLRRSGGELRVGLFAAQAPATDAAGRRREVREGLVRAPWIRELIPFDARALAVLDRAEAQAANDRQDAPAIAHDERPRPPQLHQKTQLIARPGAIAALVRQPGWEDAIADAMTVQSRQSARFAELLGDAAPAVPQQTTVGGDALLRGFERALTEAERKQVSFYYTVGTQNQDPRGMMLDGEATLVVSGFHSAAGLVDLYSVMARSTWITTRAELQRLLPAPSALMRRIARLARPAL